MFRWKKFGQLFSPDMAALEWMKYQSQNPFTMEFDDCLRVYFNTRPESGADKKNTSYPAYVDLDKDSFEVIRISQKPLLELGNKGCFDEFGIMGASIAKIGALYYLYYVGWTRLLSVPYNWAIGLAVSEDGETFTKKGAGPVIGATHNEPYLQAGCSCIIKLGDSWRLWYTTGVKWLPGGEKYESVYRITCADSQDGIHWRRHGTLCVEPVVEDEAQASPTIIRLNDKWHMFFSYRHSTDFRNKDRGYRLGYAVSDDLIHWERNDQLGGLQVSDTGWDSEMIAYPHVFTMKGSVYMLYCGNDFGKYGFGCARLEEDR